MNSNLSPSERDEIEQSAISEYRAGNIGPIQFEGRLRNAGLSPIAIQDAIRIYRPAEFKPFAK